MATVIYRNITIFFKNGDKIEVKKLPNEKWGIAGNGQYFYIEHKAVVTHDGNDYYEEVSKAVHYPTVDIDHIESDIVTRIDERREIFEHKKK